MKRLRKISAKKRLYPMGFICNWISVKLYSLMKSCDRNSSRGEKIEDNLRRIEEDVAFAKEAKNEIFFSREILTEKENQLIGCFKYVEFISFHFRHGNYSEVDRALRELGL